MYNECGDITESLSDGTGCTHIAVNRYRNFKMLRASVEEFLGGMETRDLNGRTPLHYACASGSVQLIRYLIMCGGDVKATDNHGKMPMDFAKARNDKDSLSYMGSITQAFERTQPPAPAIPQELLEKAVSVDFAISTRPQQRD